MGFVFEADQVSRARLPLDFIGLGFQPRLKLLGQHYPGHSFFIFWRVHSGHHRVPIGVQRDHGEGQETCLCRHFQVLMRMGMAPAVPQARHTKGLARAGVDAVTHR